MRSRTGYASHAEMRRAARRQARFDERWREGEDDASEAVAAPVVVQAETVVLRSDVDPKVLLGLAGTRGEKGSMARALAGLYDGMPFVDVADEYGEANVRKWARDFLKQGFTLFGSMSPQRMVERPRKEKSGSGRKRAPRIVEMPPASALRMKAVLSRSRSERMALEIVADTLDGENSETVATRRAISEDYVQWCVKEYRRAGSKASWPPYLASKPGAVAALEDGRGWQATPAQRVRSFSRTAGILYSPFIMAIADIMGGMPATDAAKAHSVDAGQLKKAVQMFNESGADVLLPEWMRRIELTRRDPDPDVLRAMAEEVDDEEGLASGIEAIADIMSGDSVAEVCQRRSITYDFLVEYLRDFEHEGIGASLFDEARENFL